MTETDADAAPDAPEAAAADPSLETVLEELRTLRAETERLDTRVTDLEDELADRTETVDTLEARIADLESQLQDSDRRLESCESETERLDALTEATRNRTGATKARLEELQARELEKGAHLRASNVDVHEVDVPGDRLERVTKSDGERYVRLPNDDDPLERETTVALAHADLLPIQQLARLDADLRRSSTDALPTRLAARLWEARADPAVDDDPWTEGCKSVREYVTAGDLKHWIRRQEPGTSDAYAKKLVSRTIDAILELSNHRLAVRKRTQRKNGLEYTERRLLLPADAEIPGETTASSSTPSDSSSKPSASSGTPSDSSSSDRSNDREPDAPDPETADVLG
ncbi:hypothetical protein D8Y22_18995 [Salinadaptatus halalkaliphilus]|uniref:Uncharacterized protein n=1 Tax=Salinadaptatus halalkaliphilus TaxID=2419781 RepID=A0A4S3THA0_9EURY|nr:hypothetical protein [Salinadaptatus halalkaliphilus]THE63252.1 hypothetical protein D8Y22_18995 [Salinadaptatus halalkaliphilus]